MPPQQPFAAFIRLIGTGPGRARSLTQAEAFEAARMMLDGTAEPVQTGAFLMLMRYRKETPEELAGFIQAVRASSDFPIPMSDIGLDWPTYASGRTRGAPLFVLAALLVAASGVKVLMHGFAEGQPYAGPAAGVLAGLGIAPCESAGDVVRALQRDNFAFLPLGIYHPGLQRLLNLRTLLGLRSPANTVARMINPGRARATISGVFHPSYRLAQQKTAALLGDGRIGVFKGGGGEAERNPAKPCDLYLADDGGEIIETWPAVPGCSPRHAATAPAPPSLAALWRGDWSDAHATAVVTGTAALALRIAGRAATPAEGEASARALWDARDKSRFGETVEAAS